MGKDKAQNLKLINRQIDRDKELLKNWKKYDISEVKRDKLQAKINKKESDKSKYQ